MTITVADITDAPELTQVELDSRTSSPADLEESLESYVSNRLDRWAGYMTGESSPQHARPERVVFKACLRDEIVGFIAGHLTTRHERDAEIQACHVRAEYQHLGVDERLLLRFLTWARQREARSLCAEVAPDSRYRELFGRYQGRDLGRHWICWDDAGLLAEQIRRELVGDLDV